MLFAGKGCSNVFNEKEKAQMKSDVNVNLMSTSIPFVAKCSLSHHKNKIQVQVKRTALWVQHATFHVSVGTPLWNHNKYIAKLKAVPSSTTVFNLDDFVALPAFVTF